MDMDKRRMKQLLEEYRNRQPEMGIISYCCIDTKESFLGISKDTKSSFNSINFKLNSKIHPNKRLQELWNLYGLDGFELKVLKVLKYENISDLDIDNKLEALLENSLLSDKIAKLF